MYYEKHYNIIIIVILMAFCAFSTIGKLAMLGSNFVPAPTGLAYTASSATTTAVTISFSMASIAGTTTYTPSTGTGAGGPSAYIISTLSSNTPYTITLIAKNNGVSSKASTSVSVLTIPTSPTTLIYSSATTTTVVITFTVPAGTGTITSYGPSTGTGSGTSTGYTISGLVSNTTYSMTLTATNASGTSAASTALSVLTIPSPPTALTYSSATTTTVVITFTVPTGTGTITSYGPSTGTGSGTSTGYTISGLSSNTTYSMTLTATNASGTSAVSSALSVLTVPGPPTIGTATVTDATHVSVTFTAPGGNGTITGYTVTSNAGSFTGTGTSSPITVTGTFVSGTAYTFTVTATNASGTSTSSGASASVTPNVGFTVIYTPGLIWTAFYNDFGASTTSTFINNTGVGTPGTGGVALTKAPIGTIWGSANNPAIAQNTGVVTDFTSLQTNTNGIILSSGFNNFSVEWTGYFLANATGLWTFTISSDDGSLLWINNDTTQYAMNGYTYANATVNNSYYQGQTARSNTANLTSGNYYFIRIQFYQGGGGYNLVFTATNPSGTIIGPNLSGYVFNIPDGLTSATAAPSAAYLAASGNTTNGTYWINLPTVGPTQIYCILDRAVDGGGWMMAMKAATGTTFNYSANYWTTNNTLNPTDTTRNTGSTNNDAKYNTMNYSGASDLLALWPDITTVGGSLTLTSYGCWSWLQNSFTTAGTPYVSTVENPTVTTVSGITASMTLINWFNTISSVRYFIQDAITWPGWKSGIFSSQTDVRFYGFNYMSCSTPRTRWGFGWNENGGGVFPGGDMGSDDVMGGIGMVNNSYSAGDLVNCCNNTTGVNRSARVEMYIRDSSSAPSPPTSVSSSISGTTATITFTGSTGASYYTAFSNTGGFFGSSATSPITITGLTSGTSYTFTVKASNASGTSAANYSGAQVQAFTTINSTTISGVIATPPSGYTNGTACGLAVDLVQAKMLFAFSGNVYYATSSNGGTSWSAFTQVSLDASTAARHACGLRNDGQYGYVITGLKSYTVTWTGTTPTFTSFDTTVTPNFTANGYFGASMTPDGLTLVVSTYPSYNLVYTRFNGTSFNAYTLTSLIPGRVACAITPDSSTIFISSSPDKYVTITWAGNVGTFSAMQNATTSHQDDRAWTFVGGNYSGSSSPTYIFGGSGNLQYFPWTQSTFTANESSITTILNPNPDSINSFSPSGTKGNIIYYVNSGNIYTITLNVT